jgi:apolipoprotein N-acyltransferase
MQPSETWGAIGKYHAMINAVRSIEHGVLLIRCSSYGYSGVFHPSGEWNTFVADNAQGTYELLVPKTFTRSATLYSYIGETFSFICCVFSLLYIVFSFVPDRILLKVFGRLTRFFALSEQVSDAPLSYEPLIQEK